MNIIKAVVAGAALLGLFATKADGSPAVLIIIPSLIVLGLFAAANAKGVQA